MVSGNKVTYFDFWNIFDLYDECVVVIIWNWHQEQIRVAANVDQVVVGGISDNGQGVIAYVDYVLSVSSEFSL